MRSLLLGIMGGSFGFMASAGVFTVFVAVGLVPRFAGKTHTASKIFLYEEMVIWGTILGGIDSIFPELIQPAYFLKSHFPNLTEVVNIFGYLGQAVFGMFAGMFVRCLALAIAEMLDSIPILARRVSFRHGLGFAILGMALGKVAGSLYYFATELHEVVK